MRFTDLTANRWWAAALRRFVVNTIVVWPMLGLYMLINQHAPGSPTTVVMPAWVPFFPSFFPIYVGLMFVTWLLPIAISDAGRFRACIGSSVCAWFLVMPWWLLAPTLLPRPPLPEGTWAHAFQWLWQVDRPYNVTPCAHGIGPVVAAWFVGQTHPTWRWALAGILMVGLPSIALVWQHRPIDILLGTGAAVVGIVIATALVRRHEINAGCPSVENPKRHSP
jgi:hypothetical protein